MKKRFLSGLVALSLMLGTTSVFAEYEYSEEYDVFEQVAGYISTYYIDDTLKDADIMNRAISEYVREDDERLLGLLKSMLYALDPYSEFFTPEEYSGFVNNVNKTFYGIGVRIEQREGYVVVTGFTSGSNAELAGVKIGDKISKINGEDMYGRNTNAVRNAIAGEFGTPVDVTVLRNGEEITFTINRGEVNEDTVFYLKLSDAVAYISIIDMADKTSAEFSEALAQADNDGITDIILDLRNNGGGYLSTAIELASMIVPEGVIVDTKYRQPFMDNTYYSELKNPKYYFNVLVNEHTASASEILASAIQESGVGQLIGEQTYGKGVIQGTFPLSNGAVFKLTIGHYETRNGNQINEIGITPDVVLENEINPIDISKYQAFTFEKKWHAGVSDVNVKAAKEKLYYLGYYDGDINETFDTYLEDAIKQFQEEKDLYPYGVLDITTQKQIDKEFAKIEVLTDLQLDKAYELFTGEAQIPDEFR